MRIVFLIETRVSRLFSESIYFLIAKAAVLLPYCKLSLLTADTSGSLSFPSVSIFILRIFNYQKKKKR